MNLVCSYVLLIDEFVVKKCDRGGFIVIDLSVHGVHKYYGSDHVIKGISFEVNSGEKVGLLGKNGAGKTTLFKMITGSERIDEGSVLVASDKKVEVLAQIPTFTEFETVEEILRSSFTEITEIHQTMQQLVGNSNPKILARYGRLMEEYDRLGGYEVDSRIDKICNGMNISQGLRKSSFQLLSGGEKTRVNLARILLRDCDILLLDEPTNHLDLDTLKWLEGFIRKFPGTVIMISHDRVFLDNVISRVIEIDNGKAHFYGGNFTVYAREKQMRLELQAEQYDRQQKEIKRIEDRAAWFVQNNRFTTKHHAILSRLDHMEKIEKPTISRKITEDFNSGGYASKEVLRLESVSKSFGSKMLMENLNLNIIRNDRVALIGPNGVGKTTLLKIIMGSESVDSGVVRLSPNIKIAYMSQIVVFKDENATILETARDAIGLLDGPTRNILARFAFTGEDVLKRVKSLSGGEKSRLNLCILMQSEANFLILDEPTNHLDIDSREWIENAVSQWDVTMLFISHDRYFLNQFASKIWSMNDGAVTEFEGGFEAYLAENELKKQVATVKLEKKKKYAKPKIQVEKKICYETLINETEGQIEAVEQAIETHLANAEYDQMDDLYQEKYQLEEQLERLYSEWENEN